MEILSKLAEFFYPTRCLVCKQAGAVVHSGCRTALPYIEEPFCHTCAMPLKDRHCQGSLCRLPGRARALDGVRSVFWHTGAGREAVLRLKYRGVYTLRTWSGQEAAEAFARFGLSNNFDLLMPVPLHPLREHKRGYNQAAIVAEPFAALSNLTYRTGWLRRERYTPSQLQVGGGNRSQNVRNAFSWQGPEISNMKILLFDDVCTSGSTLNECARVLKAKGAAEVWGFTLTREV
ncbi:MAG: phosphoribosyltransferase protein [Chloroflexi bacterium]|nr:phosphoribosyltransferase protein [Chloroflexota bacterium]